MSEPTATEIVERIKSQLPKWRAWFPNEASEVEMQRCELVALIAEIDALRTRAEIAEHDGHISAKMRDLFERQRNIAEQRAVDAETQRDKLQAFKDWTHAYLDNHGVPHHPLGTHGAEGCRIGDRMDWLMDRLQTAESERDAALAEVHRLKKHAGYLADGLAGI